ncbi:hypothetical protein [Actinoplanes couchii]|uniref:Transposase n=1 Tax=Actinoplanes couchii TaxID=403638 RepID=A0ABQ3XLV6_9ACTN|nr:hypothetical protein [Actinoplanes couchii]MDR6319287.1 hypothetical protein [Actinoplanes couchii]GID59504.1 transposase [Actinoplanes couchii]
MGRRLRTVAEPFVVAVPSGARIRAGVHASDVDHRVLFAVGGFLGSHASRDLAWRSWLGDGDDRRAVRKKTLTAAGMSSRWAGAITRASNDQWALSLRGMQAAAAGWRQAIAVLEKRIAAPVGGVAGAGRSRVRGYATQAERWQKQRRLQQLRLRLADAEQRLSEGRLSIVRGGRRLLHLRHHLDRAGLTVGDWQARWDAARLFLTADGETGKRFGNETIRWNPADGGVEINLPAPLAHLANAPVGRYRLSAAVRFNYRAGEVTDRVVEHQAVRYDISFDPARSRWFLDASWGTGGTAWKPPPLDVLQQSATLAVDLNHGHLAAVVLDPCGNPVGPPRTVPADLAGQPAGVRDGRLRAVVSTLIRIAEQAGCASVTIEDLNFTDARTTGRETMGRGNRGKRFRRIVAGLPTGRFRDRLVGMCANRRLAVVAVDPAYTSRWGGRHWQPHLPGSVTTTVADGDLISHTSGPASRHHGAAVVIGRRGLGHQARRRTGTPTTDRRTRIGTRTTGERVTAVQTGPKASTAHTPPPPVGGVPRRHTRAVTRDTPQRPVRGQGHGNRSHAPPDNDANTCAQSF